MGKGWFGIWILLILKAFRKSFSSSSPEESLHAVYAPHLWVAPGGVNQLQIQNIQGENRLCTERVETFFFSCHYPLTPKLQYAHSLHSIYIVL